MSTTLDLQRGNGIDTLLSDLRQHLGGTLTGNFATTVAALFALDNHYGLRRDDDYLLVDPWMAQYLFLAYLIVEDPEVVQAIDAGDQEAMSRLQTGRPFLVRFGLLWGEQETTTDIPEAVRNTSFRIRVMTEQEAEQMQMLACTARPDGTVILLPSAPTSRGGAGGDSAE